MAKEFTIKKGHRLWLGNYPFLLSSDATGVFETIGDSPDQLAEALATSPSMYAGHRDSLAHDEDGVDGDGKPIKIHVTYGLNGVRVEQKPDDVVDAKKAAAEQAKNVAAADKEAVKQVKADEKIAADPEMAGTPAGMLAREKVEDQKRADAKGAADDESRRKLELADHNRPGGASGPVS